MSKKRNTKKNLRNKSKNQLNNGKSPLNQFERISQMFGNPNLNKFMYLTNNSSTGNILNNFIEGDKEFHKVMESLKKDYVLKNLEKINKTNPELYTSIIENYLYNPYKKLGNKSKVWFNEFYEFISKLPTPVTLSKNEIFPLYRVMTKSEFLKTLNEGVQNPSWTIDLGILMVFLKKNLLTMDENIVIVKSIFTIDDISFSPTDVMTGEGEIWIRKGSKSIRTFVVGEYTKSQYMTQFDDSKFSDTIFSSYRETLSSLNGYNSQESQILLQSMISSSYDDVIYKFTKHDLPKLVRKLKNDSILKSLDEFNDSLQRYVCRYIDSYELLCKGLSPLTV